jgi:hypothetical protein
LQPEKCDGDGEQVAAELSERVHVRGTVYNRRVSALLFFIGFGRGFFRVEC